MSQTLTRITGQGRGLREELREIWAYRDLLALLVRRDVSVRYRQSVLGVAWAVVQPLALMLIFSAVFGAFARLPSDGLPYPLFTICGLLPWLYFSRSMAGTSDSIVGSANLVTKVYFPRLIIPISKSLSGLVDFGISFLVLALMLAWYGVLPSSAIVLLPLLVLLNIVTAFAVGVWLTALNVKYRDVGLLVPFLAQLWMYASPIAYSTSLVPEKWRFVYSLNPIVLIVDGFRWAVLGAQPPDLLPAACSMGIVLVLLITGVAHFRRTEALFADII